MNGSVKCSEKNGLLLDHQVPEQYGPVIAAYARGGIIGLELLNFTFRQSFTRSQAVARIADRTDKNCAGHVS